MGTSIWDFYRKFLSRLTGLKSLTGRWGRVVPVCTESVRASERPSPAAGTSHIHSTDEEGVRRVGEAHQSGEIKSTALSFAPLNNVCLRFLKVALKALPGAPQANECKQRRGSHQHRHHSQRERRGLLLLRLRLRRSDGDVRQLQRHHNFFLKTDFLKGIRGVFMQKYDSTNL